RQALEAFDELLEVGGLEVVGRGEVIARREGPARSCQDHTTTRLAAATAATAVTAVTSAEPPERVAQIGQHREAERIELLRPDQPHDGDAIVQLRLDVAAGPRPFP